MGSGNAPVSAGGLGLGSGNAPREVEMQGPGYMGSGCAPAATEIA
jgi:hypothetical protein